MSVASQKPLHVTTTLLDTIENELKALSWWQAVPPSAEDLASTLPFAVDTLSLAQWLQFVLLARLRDMLAAGMPLPTEISVYPVAQESFAGLSEDTRGLMAAIAQLDEALTGQPVKHEH
ncbi:MAG: YqcC family protein [Candidatus Oceanisphaera merdipullorum]|nr:YqcC family protein [Candidatus Oceanisphaera merdipullorum]